MPATPTYRLGLPGPDDAVTTKFLRSSPGPRESERAAGRELARDAGGPVDPAMRQVRSTPKLQRTPVVDAGSEHELMKSGVAGGEPPEDLQQRSTAYLTGLMASGG